MRGNNERPGDNSDESFDSEEFDSSISSSSSSGASDFSLSDSSDSSHEDEVREEYGSGNKLIDSVQISGTVVAASGLEMTLRRRLPASLFASDEEPRRSSSSDDAHSSDEDGHLGSEDGNNYETVDSDAHYRSDHHSSRLRSRNRSGQVGL